VTARKRDTADDDAGGDGEETFADALRDTGALANTEALSGRDKRITPRGGPRRTPAPRPTRFHFPDAREPLLGVADGIQASQLRRLRGGSIRPEAEIDLHGQRADEARRTLTAELRAAAESKLRCVVVIHGKGLRSETGPVLRSSLPEWLADPALGDRVLAFAPARAADGGTGATYVLLRK
jgi:DNA-nicking Smr family endonuclease